MTSSAKRLLAAFAASLVLSLALLGAGMWPAAAQETTLLPDGVQEPTPRPGGVQILFTPYLWLAGINATIQTPLPRAPSVTADVSAIDLLSRLDGLPWMSSIEIRYGPLGLLGGAFHVPVGTGLTTRDIAFTGGSTTLITNAGTGTLIYRVLEQPTNTPTWALAFASGHSSRT
jgi:hypothetical protein